MRTWTSSGIHLRTLSGIAVVVGVTSLGLQFLPGWELLAVVNSVVVLGSLVATADAPAGRLAPWSFRWAYEWLLLAGLTAYCFQQLARHLPLAGQVALLLDAHGPGLALATMCLLLGLAGLRQSRTHPGV
jgi:hypothetical protein